MRLSMLFIAKTELKLKSENDPSDNHQRSGLEHSLYLFHKTLY